MKDNININTKRDGIQELAEQAAIENIQKKEELIATLTAQLESKIAEIEKPAGYLQYYNRTALRTRRSDEVNAMVAERTGNDFYREHDNGLWCSSAVAKRQFDAAVELQRTIKDEEIRLQHLRLQPAISPKPQPTQSPEITRLNEEALTELLQKTSWPAGENYKELYKKQMEPITEIVNYYIVKDLRLGIIKIETPAVSLEVDIWHLTICASDRWGIKSPELHKAENMQKLSNKLAGIYFAHNGGIEK